MGQGEHEGWPVTAMLLPISQPSQALLPVSDCARPTGHGWQMYCPELAEYVPMANTRQDRRPNEHTIQQMTG